jgi:hypothetical protein
MIKEKHSSLLLKVDDKRIFYPNENSGWSNVDLKQLSKSLKIFKSSNRNNTIVSIRNNTIVSILTMQIFWRVYLDSLEK